MLIIIDLLLDTSPLSALLQVSVNMFPSSNYVNVITLSVTYTPYATYSKEQTGNVITFTNFEEGNILTETLHDAESGDKSDNKSIMIREKYMDTINSGDESDHQN